MTNTDKSTETKKKNPVKVIIEREFIGTKSISEVFIPIIYDDICKTAEQIRTLYNDRDIV